MTIGPQSKISQSALLSRHQCGDWVWGYTKADRSATAIFNRGIPSKLAGLVAARTAVLFISHS
jgi:hypothetical protein